MEMQNAGAPAKRSPGKYLPVKNKRAANENGKQEVGKPGVLRVHPLLTLGSKMLSRRNQLELQQRMGDSRVRSVDLSRDLYFNGLRGMIWVRFVSPLFFYTTQLIATNSETKISLKEQRPQIIK